MEANMDAVLKLQPTVWDDLNTHERIDVLQTVCNIETHYLGLNDPVTVQGDNLSPYTLGAYSDAQKLIRIERNTDIWADYSDTVRIYNIASFYNRTVDELKNIINT